MNDNPHPKGSKEHSDWLDGTHKAKADVLKMWEEVQVDEDKVVVNKDASGKVTSWSSDSGWKPSTGKDPKGKVANLSDLARRKTIKMAKETMMGKAGCTSEESELDEEYTHDVVAKSLPKGLKSSDEILKHSYDHLKKTKGEKSARFHHGDEDYKSDVIDAYHSHNSKNESVKFSESRGHKIIANKLAQIDRMSSGVAPDHNTNNQSTKDKLKDAKNIGKVEIVTQKDTSLNKEDIDFVAELNKSTLASYAKKASSSSDERSASNLASKAAAKLAADDGKDDGEKDDRKSFQRSKGIGRAVDRLSKEEVEYIDDADDIDESIVGQAKHLVKGIKRMAAGKPSAAASEKDADTKARQRYSDSKVHSSAAIDAIYDRKSSNKRVFANRMSAANYNIKKGDHQSRRADRIAALRDKVSNEEVELTESHNFTPNVESHVKSLGHGKIGFVMDQQKDGLLAVHHKDGGKHHVAIFHKDKLVHTSTHNDFETASGQAHTSLTTKKGIKSLSLNEEVEELDELSKGALKSYVDDAEFDKHELKTWGASSGGDKHDDAKLTKRLIAKRTAGIKTATKKLSKEQVEQIDDADDLDESLSGLKYKIKKKIKRFNNYVGDRPYTRHVLARQASMDKYRDSEAHRKAAFKAHDAGDKSVAQNRISAARSTKKQSDRLGQASTRYRRIFHGGKPFEEEVYLEEVEQIDEMTRDEWDKQAAKTRKISDKNASEETIHDALSSNYHEHRRLAAEHPKANSEHLHRALNDESRHVREAALRNSNATPEHIDKGLDDKEEWNRMKAAKHPNASKQNLDKAMRDKDRSVRANAAGHPNATSEHLHKAMDGNADDVKLAAVQNPNATKEHLAKAWHSHSVAVRQAARKHPNFSDNKLKEEVEGLDEADDKQYTHQVVHAKTGNVVGKYTSLKAASRASDKKDNAYGAVAHIIKPIGEEVEEMDEALFDRLPSSKAGQKYIDKKRAERDAEHKKQDPKMSKIYAKNMVDIHKASKKAAERGIKKDPEDFGWKVRNGVQRGKLPEEVQIDETETLNKYIKSLGYDPQHLETNKKVMYSKTNAFKSYAARQEALYDAGQKGTQDIEAGMSPSATARG